MAGRGSVTQVTDSRERVRTLAGLAIEENHRMWFFSQALPRLAPERRTRTKPTHFSNWHIEVSLRTATDHERRWVVEVFRAGGWR
jgi:hypothetical protein